MSVDQPSLQYPVQSVDLDVDLQDRLTANAIHNLGPSRYFDVDEETWDSVFERVGKNLAVAEAVHHDMPIDVGESELADWVDDDVIADGHYDADSVEELFPHRLDEDTAPLVAYDALSKRAPDEIAGRMAEWKTEFETLMRTLRFMPNSPTLMNAGTELQQLSACFVNSPQDSLGDINQTQSEASEVFRSGGGMGYGFHHLRPKGAPISSTNGYSSGPMTFMEVFDATCGTVKQGGTRRGAQMAIMHAEHPDIGRFCVSKRDEGFAPIASLLDRMGVTPKYLREVADGNLSNFNISIGLTDDFVEAVENDDEYVLRDVAEHGMGEEFEAICHNRHFYSPAFEDAWNHDFDKPASCPDCGEPVEENLWRDYDVTGVEEYRDRVDITVGETLTLPAGLIWALVVDGAHQNGEPGFVDLDEINRMHSFDVEEHPRKTIDSTNPCVTGDTMIATGNGLQRADELYEAGTANDVVVDSRIDGADGETTKEASNVYQTGIKDVVRLTTDRGYDLRLTEDHRVMTQDGWVEAGGLDEGDEIHIQDQKGEFGNHGSAELGRILGWLVGDGYLKHEEERAVLSFQDEGTNVADAFASDANQVVRSPSGKRNEYTISANDVNRSGGGQVAEKRVRSTRLYELAEEAGLVEKKLSVPDAVYTGSEAMAAGFLSALFTADGQVQGSKEKGLSVRLTSVSTDLLKEVQKVLLNFGIVSTIYEERHEAGVQEMPDGHGGTKEYDCQARHDLVISKDNLERFRDEIGFQSDRKQDALEAELDRYTRGPYGEDFTATVETVEDDGTEAVYDLTEPDTESFIADGVVVHNCAEQPLQEMEACNLGHVNLSLVLDEDAVSYDQWRVENPDADVEAYVEHALDLPTFTRIVESGTRFLDNVVTMSRFPIEEIEMQVRRHRKIGLGLMGFAEMLMQMGVQYGSDVSFDIAREIQRLITKHSVRTSMELAEDRGVFPAHGDSKWADPAEYEDWVGRYGVFDGEQIEELASTDRGVPMRNHNTTTIAPTGTTSMIGNTTGGCEPMYSVIFFKNVGDDVQGDEMLVEVSDYFEAVLEANDFDVDAVTADMEQLMLDNEFEGPSSVDRLPDELDDVFTATTDVSIDEHVDMQAAFQRYNMSGISKTLNLPNEATRKDMSDAILRAVDQDIKGATVYRDGSRSAQVKTTRLDNELDDPLLQYLDLDDVVGTVLTENDPVEVLTDLPDLDENSVAGQILSAEADTEPVEDDVEERTEERAQLSD